MNGKADRWSLTFRLLALAASVTTLLISCTRSESQEKPLINIDGSSTVYPITQAIASEFQKQDQNKIEVQVGVSGTGGGFKKFCAGEIDISNASRPIQTEEMEACNKGGVRYIELPIAFDALTVVVNPKNSWAKDITLAELKKMWSPAAALKITRWNQIRANWPDQPLNLYGAGRNSGTFDYFTEAVVGKAKASRNDYTASEDDNVLVQGVSKNLNSLGYFGFAYYEGNKSQLKALAVNNGKGSVLPSRQTVEKAQYQPLSRPLFIYVNFKSAQNKPEVQDFVNFYLKKVPTLASSVGYVPLPDDAYHLDYVHFTKGKVGTVFAGEASLNLTLAELLRKQATF